MNTVPISKLKQIVATPMVPDALLPLLLFGGNLTYGRAQGLFNFTVAMMECEVKTLKEATWADGPYPSSKHDYSRDGLGREVEHLVGLHRPVQKPIFGSWFGRLLACHSVLRLRPGIEDYVRSLIDKEDRFFLRSLDRIDRYSPWSNQAWRRPKPRRRRTRPITNDLKVDVPSFYPFITETPGDEHELLMAVDACVPRSLPQSTREDVCQDLIVAVLCGEVTPGNLQDDVAKYIHAAFKAFPLKYGHLRLDAPPPWNPDGRSLGETLVNHSLGFCMECEAMSEKLQDGVCERCIPVIEARVAARQAGLVGVEKAQRKRRKPSTPKMLHVLYQQGKRLDHDDIYVAEVNEQMAEHAIGIPAVEVDEYTDPLWDIAKMRQSYDDRDDDEEKPPRPNKGKRKRLTKKKAKEELERRGMRGEPRPVHSQSGAGGHLLVTHMDTPNPKKNKGRRDSQLMKSRWDRQR